MSWRTYTDWAKRRPLALKLAERLGRGRGGMRWLDDIRSVTPARFKPDLSNWEQHELAATWLGHATVLLRIGGLTILTDPVFSTRIGVGLGLLTGGPQRLVAPPVKLRELPKLDLILISHAHFDHLDRPTLSRLPKRTPIIMARDNLDLVCDLGFRNVTELRWGESTDIGGVKITSRQVQHWGARTFFDQHRGYSAFLIESSQHRVLYGGDSAYHDHFRDIGGIDLAVMGIGAYDPYIAAHATPEQALSMADHVKAERILPMHHSTFRLSYEPITEPLERMMAAVGRNVQRLVACEVGRMWSAHF
jgi:L-ascorbate metabolism protein UlaG (beta-lactamase superfamily)